MSRPLVEPICSRYLQISVSITTGLMPVSSSDCGSAGWNTSSDKQRRQYAGICEFDL